MHFSKASLVTQEAKIFSFNFVFVFTVLHQKRKHRPDSRGGQMSKQFCVTCGKRQRNAVAVGDKL